MLWSYGDEVVLLSDVRREPLPNIRDKPCFTAWIAKRAKLWDRSYVDNTYRKRFIKLLIKKFCLPHVPPAYSITSSISWSDIASGVVPVVAPIVSTSSS